MRQAVLFLLLGYSTSFAASYKKLGTVPYTATAVAPVSRAGDAVYIADGSAGKYGCGQIQILENGKKRTIYVFNGYRGKEPTKLLATRKGVFGITVDGGHYGSGTLFRIRGNRIQILAHFTEASGSPQSLLMSGNTLYGACGHGAYRLRGRNLEFYPLSGAYSAAMLKGSLYASRNYFYELNRFDGNTPTVVLEDWPAWTIPGKGTLLGIDAYGGKYTYGRITEFKPTTGAKHVLVDFQSYNGGRPGEIVVLRNGKIFGANSDGIWQISKRPRKVLDIDSVRTLGTDGRRLFGLAGLLPKTVFRLRP